MWKHTHTHSKHIKNQIFKNQSKQNINYDIVDLDGI